MRVAGLRRDWSRRKVPAGLLLRRGGGGLGLRLRAWSRASAAGIGAEIADEVLADVEILAAIFK